MHRPLRMAGSPRDCEPDRGQYVAAFVSRCPRIVRQLDETWSRFPLIAILLNCLVFLVPLAAASPPDPVWISGIYDDADSDNVVVAATSLESRLDGHPLVVSPVTMVAYILPEARGEIPTPMTLRSVHSRAPPTS